MLIGVTGTVGSGKSGVAAILANVLRCPALDTDQICRELLQPGGGAEQSLEQRWPGRFTDDQGMLDRRLLRQAVFTDPGVRQVLEQILHPLVREVVWSTAEQAAAAGRNLLVEVPLLFEVGWQDDFETVVAVYASRQVCLVRTVRRDQVSVEQAEAILALQLPPEDKAERADWVIDNGGIWASTVLQVHWLACRLGKGVQ